MKEDKTELTQQKWKKMHSNQSFKHLNQVMYTFVLPNFESQLMLFSRIIVGFYVCVWERDSVCVCVCVMAVMERCPLLRGDHSW